MPFYGDELDQLTRALRTGSSVVNRGEGDLTSPTERALLEALRTRNGVTDEAVAQELGAEVVARGPANWEWVQATARALERRVPAFRKLGLSFVKQVDAYLNRPHVAAAVDEIVEPHLVSGRAIVVAHSLGSIVAYRILRRRGSGARVPLLVTLGSPLGINAVKDRLRPPALQRPEGVGLAQRERSSRFRGAVRLLGRSDVRSRDRKHLRYAQPTRRRARHCGLSPRPEGRRSCGARIGHVGAA